MPSFDVVSQVDMQEVRNAVDQANREISTRFDFKGSNSRVEQDAARLVVIAGAEFQVDQAREILIGRLAKRGIDVGCLDTGKVEKAAGDTAKQEIVVREGIDADLARRLVKRIKENKLKVQASIQGDQVRVSGKKRDDLQDVIAILRKEDFGLPLQFVNFRD